MNKPPNLILPRFSRPIARAILRWRPGSTSPDEVAAFVEAAVAVWVVCMIGDLAHGQADTVAIDAVVIALFVSVWHRWVDHDDHDGTPPGPRSAAA